jgi:glycosyltransferase involved in cell wall biosynthesis
VTHDVLFVVPHDSESPGPRYRVFQFLPHYERAGLRSRVVTVEGREATLRSLRSVHASAPGRVLHYVAMWLDLQATFAHVLFFEDRFDVLYLYRIPVPRWAAFLLERGHRRVLFDFDDALDAPDVAPGAFEGLRRRVLRDGFRNAVRVARVTIASNQRNARAVERLGGEAVVVPTCVDLSRYTFRERDARLNAGLVIGWIGTPSTSMYLSAIEDALERLRAMFSFSVRLVGATESPFRSLDAEMRPWRLETEAQEIAAFDIGLMPMPDSPWASGKAALKAIQYGASGAPTVASRTETNVEILGSDDGALFASTPEEWVAAIARLLADGGLRSELGRRGRARVEHSFSVATQLPRLLEVLHRDGGN